MKATTHRGRRRITRPYPHGRMTLSLRPRWDGVDKVLEKVYTDPLSDLGSVGTGI